MQTLHRLFPLAFVVSLTSAACVPPQDAPPQQPAQPAANTAGSQPEGQADADQSLQPSPRARAIAEQLGFPAVGEGSSVAGPFDGPNGTIWYASNDGKLSFFDPNTAITYMATLQPEQWVYLMAPQGFFAVVGDQVTQVAEPPADIATWPQAEAMARVAIAVREQQMTQGTQPSGDTVPWGTMTDLSTSMHDTNMTIINNIGGAGCTDHYDGPYFVGCY